MPSPDSRRVSGRQGPSSEPIERASEPGEVSDLCTSVPLLCSSPVVLLAPLSLPTLLPAILPILFDLFHTLLHGAVWFVDSGIHPAKRAHFGALRPELASFQLAIVETISFRDVDLIYFSFFGVSTWDSPAPVPLSA